MCNNHPISVSTLAVEWIEIADVSRCICAICVSTLAVEWIEIRKMPRQS